MKMSEQMKIAQGNMTQGFITADGFLGDETHSLIDMIAEDEKEMLEAGLNYEFVAEKLHYLMDEGRKGLGEPVTIDSEWLVRTDEARGHLPCPFEDGIFRKINVTVTPSAGGDSLLYSDLSLHLFEEHHFLQGKGSPFRLDPVLLKKVLFS